MSMADCPPYTVVSPAWPTDPPAVWCDPQAAMLVAGLPDSTENCALALTAAQEATWILDSLTGHQFHGPEAWREEYALIDRCRLQLRQSPINTITAVGFIDSCADPATEPTPVEWCQTSASKINLCPGACGPAGWQTSYALNGFSEYVDFPWRQGCGCEQPHVRVEYETTNTLPPGAASAAMKLASEKLKSVMGKPCQLPERVNTITRQGVTWTVLDPQDFLTAGMTGVSQVDAFIVTARRARPNVHVTDPLYGRLVKSELLGLVPPP